MTGKTYPLINLSTYKRKDCTTMTKDKNVKKILKAGALTKRHSEGIRPKNPLHILKRFFAEYSFTFAGNYAKPAQNDGKFLVPQCPNNLVPFCPLSEDERYNKNFNIVILVKVNRFRIKSGMTEKNIKHLFTHSLINLFTSKKLVAFTLAEVLITLGVIGVVAAMTIPTLMTNIRAKQYSTKFKKTLSTLNNAGRMSLAKYDFDYADLNKPCNSNSASDNPETTHSVCALFNGTLAGKTFYWGRNNFPEYKIDSKFAATHWSMGYNSTSKPFPIYILQDGTIIMLSSNIGNTPCTVKTGSADGGLTGTGCYGVIDVNGFAPPNKESVCTKGKYSWLSADAGDCIVDRKDVYDIYPIVFYNSTVQPVSNAGWYIFNQNYYL